MSSAQSVCLFLCRRRRRICSICLIIAKRYVDWDEHEKWNAHELHEWEPRTALGGGLLLRKKSIKNQIKNLGARPRNRRAIQGSLWLYLFTNIDVYIDVDWRGRKKALNDLFDVNPRQYKRQYSWIIISHSWLQKNLWYQWNLCDLLLLRWRQSSEIVKSWNREIVKSWNSAKAQAITNPRLLIHFPHNARKSHLRDSFFAEGEGFFLRKRKR